jgi:hypothetical protein
MRIYTAEEQAMLDATPNCSVPDCHWKAYLDTGKCHAHTFGKVPKEFGEGPDWIHGPTTSAEFRKQFL